MELKGLNTTKEPSAQDEKKRSFKYFLTTGWGGGKRKLELETDDFAYIVVFKDDGTSKIVAETRAV